MSANIRHSSESAEHFTPSDIVEAARIVMGGIDLDPATTAFANKERVKAKRFYTRVDNGFTKPWKGSVFLNPPGGRCDDNGKRVKVGGQSSAKAWWRKLVHEYDSGRVTQAIFVGFSLEILQSAQLIQGEDTHPPTSHPLFFPFCVPIRRTKYARIKRGKFVVGARPPHASVFIFIPPLNTSAVKDDAHYSHAIELFGVEFSKFGVCIEPRVLRR